MNDMAHKGFNKEPGNHNSIWAALMDMDLVLQDGSRCKLKDNIKSVTFKEKKRVTNGRIPRI